MFSWIKNIFSSGETVYDFNKSNPLGGGGERVDITFDPELDFTKLDIYQKSHFKRYEFAKSIINASEICGDFACGTGYGSAMLATKCAKVVGADINHEVIEAIKKRYRNNENIDFRTLNLLVLKFENYFDSIISFETIEHFYEDDINKLLGIYAKSLKKEGKLIFSTPYMQKQSKSAEKLGFHLTFYFNEEKIADLLLKNGFMPLFYKFQNYETHTLEDNLVKKDFIICVAKKV